MRSRRIDDLRSDAKGLLDATELEHVSATDTQFILHEGIQSPPFDTETRLSFRGEEVDGHVNCFVTYTTNATAQDGADQPTPIWTARVTGVASFATQGKQKPTANQLEAFALMVGVPVVHPYARMWTQTLTGFSPYPAFTLGVFTPHAERDGSDEVELPDDPVT